ncbi:MAG: transposase [Nitrosopumilaceae archaeon]|nr:transposase [Nitrosopumilaceae archaeon]
MQGDRRLRARLARVQGECGRVPRGDGRVILDAAYLARANCDAIAHSGHTPVMCSKKNSRFRDFHAMGRMLRWRRDDPEEFDSAYHRRSPVETAFSVIKERFGAVARAKTFAMRELHLVLKCVCYNLVA